MSEKMQVAQVSKYMQRKDSGGWNTRKKQIISQNHAIRFEILYNNKVLNLRVK